MLSRKLQIIIFLIICFSISYGCSEDCPTNSFHGSNVIHVSKLGEFQTIAEALEHAKPRDRILVSAGTYRESLIITIPVTIESKDGPENTILDGEGKHRCILIDKADGTELIGLRIINGFSETRGSGVRVNDCYILMKNCILENNINSLDGGAFAIREIDGYADIEDCSFINNHADHSAGAVHIIYDAIVNLYQCWFIGNTSNLYAGAITCLRWGTVNIENCLFRDNSSDSLVSVISIHGAEANIVNNTFYGNSAPHYGSILFDNAVIQFTKNIIAGEELGYGVYDDWSLQVHNSCNIFWQNAKGSIGGRSLSLDPTDMVIDPLFCNIETNNFRVHPSSPACVDSNSCHEHIGAFEDGCD